CARRRSVWAARSAATAARARGCRPRLHPVAGGEIRAVGAQRRDDFDVAVAVDDREVAEIDRALGGLLRVGRHAAQGAGAQRGEAVERRRGCRQRGGARPLPWYASTTPPCSTT